MRALYTTALIVGCLVCNACGESNQRAASSSAPGIEATGWETQTPMDKPLAGEKVAVVEATVAVEEVNLAGRHLTVKRPDGSVVTVKAGPEIKRLAEIKPGDSIVLSYILSVAYEVRPATVEEKSNPVAGAAVAERNEASLPPGASMASVIHRVVTIASIDRQKPSVTIKDADGQLSVIPVKRPENLERVKVGDTVAITYVEATAVNIDPVKL